jgi:hypothetical protein
LQY